MKHSFILLFFALQTFFASSQVNYQITEYPNITDGTYTPPDPQRLNLVILADGYTSINTTDADGEYNDGPSAFKADANDFIAEFLATPPFAEYQNYFKIYKIFVESTNGVITHPCATGACAEEYEPCSPTPCTPTVLAVPCTTTTTYFESSYDCLAAGSTTEYIHRLVQPNYTTVNSFVNDYFLSLADPGATIEVFKVVLANSEGSGGCGSPENQTATVTSGDSRNGCAPTTLPTPGNILCDERMAIHELAHSFGLMDEYYYAASLEGPNKDDITIDGHHKWDHWKTPQAYTADGQAIDYYHHWAMQNCNINDYYTEQTNWFNPLYGRLQQEHYMISIIVHNAEWNYCLNHFVQYAERPLLSEYILLLIRLFP